MMADEDKPILSAPPQLIPLEPKSKSKSNNNINSNSNLNVRSNNSVNNNNNLVNPDQAMKNVMAALARQKSGDGKDRIDRTVLTSSSTFMGKPYINMKEFLKIIQNNPSEKLDALYNLLDEDSDSIIGFIELNGLSYINEWLHRAIITQKHDFILCILQFLLHSNLEISFQSLNQSSIAKTVNQLLSHSLSSKPSSSTTTAPKLTNDIQNQLRNTFNINIKSSTDHVITRDVIHQICHTDNDNDHLAVIKYLEAHYAHKCMTKWKKIVSEFKRKQVQPHYRRVAFGDEKGKTLVMSTTFSLLEPPLNISEERDKKRRDKMLTTVKWNYPSKLFKELNNNSSKNIKMKGSKSLEKKIQKERESNELEEICFGNDNLKEPKSLSTNHITSKQNKNILKIPLETEQPPDPQEQKQAKILPQQPMNIPNPNPNPNPYQQPTYPPHHMMRPPPPGIPPAYPQQPHPGMPPPPNIQPQQHPYYMHPYPPPPGMRPPPGRPGPPGPPMPQRRPGPYPPQFRGPMMPPQPPPPHGSFQSHMLPPHMRPPPPQQHMLPPPQPQMPSKPTQQPQSQPQAQQNGKMLTSPQQQQKTVINIPDPGTISMNNGNNNNNKSHHRRRDFTINRPSKRQKLDNDHIHDRDHRSIRNDRGRDRDRRHHDTRLHGHGGGGGGGYGDRDHRKERDRNRRRRGRDHRKERDVGKQDRERRQRFNQKQRQKQRPDQVCKFHHLPGGCYDEKNCPAMHPR